MTQEQFRKILGKYLQGTCTEEEKAVIDDWYATIGEGETRVFSEEEDDRLKDRYWSAVNRHIQNKKNAERPEPVTVRSVFSLRSFRAAAVLAAIILTVTFLQLRSRSHQILASSFKDDMPYMKYISNYEGKPFQVSLPDGSKVILEDSSRIYYPSAFNGPKREVYLQGQAFFEVSHDVHRTFLVYAGEVMTQVLGTSFTIVARPADQNITVSVRTGKVSVFVPQKSLLSQKYQVETILTPNQQVVYDRSQNTTAKTLVKVPQPVVPMEEVGRVRFEEAPVADIFKALEKMYGVKITFDETIFRKCVLTTAISEGELYSRIDIICKAIGASYIVENTQIVIHGSGCN